MTVESFNCHKWWNLWEFLVRLLTFNRTEALLLSGGSPPNSRHYGWSKCSILELKKIHPSVNLGIRTDVVSAFVSNLSAGSQSIVSFTGFNQFHESF